MTKVGSPVSVIRAAAEGGRRWFYGGGVHTWKATAEETDNAFLLFEDRMQKGKVTPLHTHPTDETMYVLEGEILVHVDGVKHPITTGGLVFAPRGIPHAFLVVSDVVRLLCLHTPGTCEAFYLGASEPLADGEDGGVVDFDRIRASGEQHGGIDILGPPPFTDY